MSDYILSDEPCPKCGGRTIQNHTGHECGSNSCDWNASHADARLAALETENARLREVVERYADGHNWLLCDDEHPVAGEHWLHFTEGPDEGPGLAREALRNLDAAALDGGKG